MSFSTLSPFLSHNQEEEKIVSNHQRLTLFNFAFILVFLFFLDETITLETTQETHRILSIF